MPTTRVGQFYGAGLATLGTGTPARDASTSTRDWDRLRGIPDGWRETHSDEWATIPTHALPDEPVPIEVDEDREMTDQAISTANYTNVARIYHGSNAQRTVDHVLGADRNNRTKYLILRVALFDLEAAAWLLDAWDNRETSETRFQLSTTVDGTLTWSETPQGTEYWSWINYIDGELRNDLREAVSGNLEHVPRSTIL